MSSMTATPERQNSSNYVSGSNSTNATTVYRDPQTGSITLSGIKPQIMASQEASADRFVINVSGLKFETHAQTLEQ